MLELNEEKSLVVGREDLGTIRTLIHRGQTVRYRLPDKIENQVTLRFRGRGKTVGQETGDLLLHITVDRGKDIRAVLWLTESEARSGFVKTVKCGSSHYPVRVPAGIGNGQVLRLNGRGAISESGRIGDALISVCVFPDRVEPNVHSVDGLSVEDLSLEGWVYRRADEILAGLRQSPFAVKPFTAVRAANLFNEMGWEGIGWELMSHLGLQRSGVSFESHPSLPRPGQCFTKMPKNSRGLPVHTISIHSKFLDNPFAVTAILAHEFCHVLELNHRGNAKSGAPNLMDVERTVDLLVFLFGLGEFQLRVARQNRMTFGYFNQELFERMYVIWSRKQREFKGRAM